jgi:hypothetical protein
MELLEDAALTGTQQLLDDLGHATSPGKFAAGAIPVARTALG